MWCGVTHKNKHTYKLLLSLLQFLHPKNSRIVKRFRPCNITYIQTIAVARINVPLEALGKALVVPEDEVRSERGPKLSPASKFMIRGDIKHLVKVPVTDEADPTTYLLISTRRPEELASALNANRA